MAFLIRQNRVALAEESTPSKKKAVPSQKEVNINVQSSEPLFAIHIGETTIVIGRAFARVLISIFAIPIVEPAGKLISAALRHFGS
jgi:hypothetical protein